MTGTDTYSSTDLQYSIPEIWGPKVNELFKAKLGAANFFTDLSADMPEGDTLNIPGIYSNVFEAKDKSNGDEVTLQSPAQTNNQLSVDTWKEVSYLIEDKELKQMKGSLNLQGRYAKQAAYTIKKALDTSLMSLYSGLSQTVNDTANNVDDVSIREAVEELDSRDVPQEDRMFFFHPTVYWHDIMGIAKYYDASQAGWNNEKGPIISGNFGSKLSSGNGIRGMLYGVPVMTTTQVQADGADTAYFNMLAHKDAFVFAVQTPGGNRVRVQTDYQVPNLGMLWVNDIIYGVKENRDDAAVVIESQQSGVVS